MAQEQRTDSGGRSLASAVKKLAAHSRVETKTKPTKRKA